MSRIIHLGGKNLFTVPYFEFLARHFDARDHFFIIRPSNVEMDEKNADLPLPSKELDGAGRLIYFSLKALKSDRIILHGLSDRWLMVALLLQPWLLKKVYWVIWGGDLYGVKVDEAGFKYSVKEWIKRQVFRRIPYFVTFIRDDFDFAQKKYAVRGLLAYCVIYPNLFVNVPKVDASRKSAERPVRIMVGNSARSLNRHEDIFQEIQRRDPAREVHVYCPLGYNDNVTPGNGKKVAELGQSMFGDRFSCDLDLLPMSRYVERCQKVQVAIFGGHRPQAVATISLLVALGVKVVISPRISTWRVFKDIGVELSSLDDFDLTPLSTQQIETNIERIKQHFNEQNSAAQWGAIFGTTRAEVV